MPRCKECKEKYTRTMPLQVACSVKCAIAVGAKAETKKKAKESAKRKRDFLDSDIKHWKKKAREVFHAYIRQRDKDLPCVSCGRVSGCQWHAGHYRPSGINSALRYDERNVHKQCAQCNNHKSGNLFYYRLELITRIGIDVVLELEHNNETRRWTVDDLKEVFNHYKQR